MPHPTPDEQKSRRTVLELIADKTGQVPKVLLSDFGSEHGASPVIDPQSAASKLVPQGRSKYQLAGEIARGGMGVILKGHDTDLGRDVALKVLDSELAKRPNVVQRFVEEAQIGGQLQHPGIVPVYELGLMADDSPYFTMKLVKGRTLAALLQQRKSLADNRGRLLSIFESVCQTMAYAHSKSVLHRDLKPANIMVGAFGEVQVVDWGLAKVLHRGGVADEKRAKESLLTVIETVRSGPGSSGSDSIAGSVMGTPAYMAPEQAQGEVENLDERADVFSLGGILCEILTGRPPYVEIAGEGTLVQAARAKLEPARAAIEACDADQALVRLCLECLTPARAARPANADEVAKAVHAYLTSVEERAQKAELAAVEARMKASEERRARRLTLALAGTIVTAVALGGAAFWWIGRERERQAEEHAARVEQTRAAVEAAHGESIEFGRAGKPDEALAAARRALALAESGAADAALRERARGFVAQAEQDVGAAERERKLREQDEALQKRLVDLRLGQIRAIGNPRLEIELDAAFAQAFRDYGVDLEGDDLVPALTRIRERDIAEEVALALDDWGRVRRGVLGSKSEKAENLFVLAMDLDPEPGRLRLRQAIFDNDLTTLLELAAPENLPKLAPGSIWVLSATLWDRFEAHQADVYRMYDQARHLYPSDYVLQSVAGNIYQAAGRLEESLACRTAALSLRPNDITARRQLGEALYFIGRLKAAEVALRACVATDKSSAESWYVLGLTLAMLGNHPESLVCLSRSLELEDEPTRRPDLAALRFFNGVISRGDVERLLVNEPAPNNYITYLWALLEHPDPKQRNPELVLQHLELTAAQNGESRWVHVMTCLARARTGDWAAALVSLDRLTELPGYLVLSPGAYDFVRSLIYSHLGRAGEARESFRHGMVAWDDLTGRDPTGWERSDVMRWRREAEAALAK